jgi:hypothetical protein
MPIVGTIIHYFKNPKAAGQAGVLSAKGTQLLGIVSPNNA